MDDRFDLVYRLLDDQLVDVDGRRCGRVDDVELTGAPGEPLILTGLLSGRGAYAARMPARLRRLARRVFGEDVRGSTVRGVPWAEVDDLNVTVQLLRRAQDLGLAEGDTRVQMPIERLPRG